jgi:hypothetical protein
MEKVKIENNEIFEMALGITEPFFSVLCKYLSGLCGENINH